MLKIIFHKEPERVGGGITEINYNGKRLIIDMGADMDKGFDYVEPNPNIDGLTVGKNNVGAILITHYHPDHIGLLKYALPDIPVYMSEATQKIAEIMECGFTPNAENVSPYYETLQKAKIIRFENFGKPFIPCEGFEVIPLRVDHSAFDAMAYVIKADGKKIFFTGDYREHGYTGFKTKKLFKMYAGDADVIITEGTQVSRHGDGIISENKLQKGFTDICKRNKYVLYMGSSTNLDSIISIALAAKKTGKCFGYIDEFSQRMAETLAGFAKSDLYKGWQPVERDVNKGRVVICRLGNVYYIKNFFEKYGKDTVLVYSMWSGYIDQEAKLQELEKDLGNRFVKLHSSGHASRELIQAVLAICGKAKVLPMHTESFAEFKKICRASRVVELKKGVEYVV
ncbi:MAG: MBL fold metallo-hydrolase [Acidaminococcaceae bacterium]|nr:MBL fold metallo-hydrolase [Acidaminococcaceae bacterium]